MREIESAHPVTSDLDLVALHPKRALQDVRDRVIVFHDQHARRALVIDHWSARWYGGIGGLNTDI